MTVFPSAARPFLPVKTAGASSSVIRVIGGATMRPVTTASATRSSSWLEGASAKLIPVTPAASSAWASATYLLVIAVPPGRTSAASAPNPPASLATFDHRVDAIGMGLAHRVRKRDGCVVDGFGSAVAAHPLGTVRAHVCDHARERRVGGDRDVLGVDAPAFGQRFPTATRPDDLRRSTAGRAIESAERSRPDRGLRSACDGHVSPLSGDVDTLLHRRHSGRVATAPLGSKSFGRLPKGGARRVHAGCI